MQKNKLYKYKWIIHVLGFAVIFGIMLCLTDYITGKNVYQSSIWEKVQDPDANIDILIMGNSHAYTSVDAVVLSDCMGKEIDILGSGGQNMEGTLATLKIVLTYKKPKVIMLDVYSACVNTKNELQNEKRGMLYNNLDGVNNYFLKGSGVWNIFKWNNFFDGTFQLFRPTSTWDRWNFKKREKSDTHGYVGRKSYAYVERNIEDYVQEVEQIYLENIMTDLQEYNVECLKEFLDITEKNNIPIILYNIPTLEPSISQRVNKVFELASAHGNVIQMEDMALRMKDMGLESEDFYDSSHLNQRGAEKFTKYMGDFLAEKLDLEIDWDRAFAYKSEMCESIGEGRYRYTVENYDLDCLYQFRLLIDGEVAEQQDYSENNTFVTDYNVGLADTNVRLLCYMIPAVEKNTGDSGVSRISMEFMKQNDCHVE